MTIKPRIQLAVSAIVHNEGKYLLVRRGNPPDVHNWAFPGGRVEAGETTRDAVLRELAEETRLRGTVGSVFDVYDFVASNQASGVDSVPFHFTLIVYRVDVEDISCAKAASDAAAIDWVSPIQAMSRAMPASMHDAFRRLAGES